MLGVLRWDKFWGLGVVMVNEIRLGTNEVRFGVLGVWGGE